MKRDGDYIRDNKGGIVAEGWPVVPTKRRRQLLNTMAAAPEMREALMYAERLARRHGANAAELAPIQDALRKAQSHPAVSHGLCDVCGHYGSDCTGIA